jgi:long-subunit acyl-CoA synthetase (AMP-forming)
MPGVQLALGDIDPDTGTGELLVRSAQVMTGYWNRPETILTPTTILNIVY